MQIQPQFEQLVAELRAQFPDARVELESLPSGFQDLSFVRLERLWVFVYSPTHAEFGVDEVDKDEGFGVGYNHVFQNLEAAKQKFLQLISLESSEGATVVKPG